MSALGVRDEMDPKPDSVSGYQEAGWGIRPAMILKLSIKLYTTWRRCGRTHSNKAATLVIDRLVRGRTVVATLRPPRWSFEDAGAGIKPGPPCSPYDKEIMHETMGNFVSGNLDRSFRL